MEQEKDTPRLYANSVNTAMSVYDITLHFKTQSPIHIESAGDVKVAEKDAFDVIMSLQHAKALAVLLTRQVAAYEQQYGITLPVPPDIAKNWIADTSHEKESS